MVWTSWASLASNTTSWIRERRAHLRRCGHVDLSIFRTTIYLGFTHSGEHTEAHQCRTKSCASGDLGVVVSPTSSRCCLSGASADQKHLSLLEQTRACLMYRQRGILTCVAYSSSAFQVPHRGPRLATTVALPSGHGQHRNTESCSKNKFLDWQWQVTTTRSTGYEEEGCTPTGFKFPMRALC